jgi:hypothetical protein
MPVYRQALAPSANSVPYVVTVQLANTTVQPLVMVARVSSGGQSARTICTRAGKKKTNLHVYLIISPIKTGDCNRQLLQVSLQFSSSEVKY